jgi:hypothetical protein
LNLRFLSSKVNQGCLNLAHKTAYRNSKHTLALPKQVNYLIL